MRSSERVAAAARRVVSSADRSRVTARAAGVQFDSAGTDAWEEEQAAMEARDASSRSSSNAQPQLQLQDDELALLAVQLRHRGAAIAHIQATLGVSRRRARRLVAQGMEAARRQASERRHEFNNAAHVARTGLRELRSRTAAPDDQALLDEVDKSVTAMARLFKTLATAQDAIGEP
jgi:hypothetical protein